MPQSKGQKIEALYHESEKFRKDTVLKWKKALVGSYTVKHMDQDLLISILRYLVDISFRIEEYSMKIAGKSPDMKKVEMYLKLIEELRKLMPLK